MSNTLVIFDSTWGNTEKIAWAIGNAIKGEVKVLSVGEADPDEVKSVDLLIVGCPTQAFRPTRPATAFIDNFPKDGLKGIRVAAFDTRMPAGDVGKGLRFMMKIGGYAAPRLAEALKGKGGDLVSPSEGFFVKDKEGPLKEGELERAAAWAQSINATN